MSPPPFITASTRNRPSVHRRDRFRARKADFWGAAHRSTGFCAWRGIPERSDRAYRPARRLLPPIPPPREGVWGWGNGKKVVLPAPKHSESRTYRSSKGCSRYKPLSTGLTDKLEFIWQMRYVREYLEPLKCVTKIKCC